MRRGQAMMEYLFMMATVLMMVAFAFRQIITLTNSSAQHLDRLSRELEESFSNWTDTNQTIIEEP